MVDDFSLNFFIAFMIFHRVYLLNVMLDYIIHKNYMLWQGIQINKLICWTHKLMVELNSFKNREWWKKKTENGITFLGWIWNRWSLGFFDRNVSVKFFFDRLFFEYLNGFTVNNFLSRFFHLHLFCLFDFNLNICDDNSVMWFSLFGK